MYPNIIGRGSGYVITDDLSGGLVFPREPRGNIRVAAYGRGVRTNKHGFQRDQSGGNRIPKVGLERRAIALGSRVSQPDMVTLSAIAPGRRGAVARAAVHACKCGRKSAREARQAELDARPGVRARSECKLRRQAANDLNAALREAAAEIRSAESEKKNKSLSGLVAMFSTDEVGLKGGL